MAVSDLYHEADPLALVRGEALNTVTAAGQSLYVKIPSHQDPTASWGPCAWTPHVGPSYPQKGSLCLVGFDEARIPWVVAWS